MARATRRQFLAGAALLSLGLAGCGKAEKTPDRMTTAEFQSWLAGQTGMTDLSLTDQGGGKFTGTGKKDGKTWQVKVTREDRRVNWEAQFEGPASIEKMAGHAGW
jgi:hypothetical protein